MPRQTRCWFSPILSFLILILTPVILNLSSFAQTDAMKNPLLSRSRDRVSRPIDEEQRVTIPGNRHPLAQPEFDTGAVAPDYPMNRMILVLKPDAAQLAALNDLVYAQHNPESPLYHQWLTPENFGELFGVSENDLAQVTNWLQTHAMSVEEVTAGRRAIVFSGTAAQVESAFHTQIHTYNIGGEIHHANASDPEIPSAISSVVGGVASLHDFRSQPMHRELKAPSPQFTSGSSHYLAPADFATIYDLAPLYQQSLNGTGQSIAIVGRTNINLSDVETFRSTFGLPANNPQVIVNGTDPGIVSYGEEIEADLDVEWSGAVAKNATIKFVVSASTNTSDGTYLSAQYIVNHNLAPVMSTSFGLCEAYLGTSGNSFLNSLWQQAAAEGITAFVSSGDSGAAGCDSSSASTAAAGRAVNGLCSTPYSVCVGGAEFNDASNPGLYWTGSNASGTQASAVSYIPEVVWNESGSSGLWASGGGGSTVYTKPSWQVGSGVPADSKRDVPDVSLSAAGHDGYLIYINGSLGAVGGTSAASPSFAGLMALVVQEAATRQGNANTAFYVLASKQRTGGAAIFHDITSGNNSVPGLTGFTAGTGYDQATGLGSVDANLLVTHWADATIVPAFQLNETAGALSVAASGSGSVNVSVAVSGGFSSAVTLSASGLPSGVTATLTPTKFVAPGSGTSAFKLTASSAARAASTAVTVTAAGGGITKNVALTLTVTPPPTYALAASSGSLSVSPGHNGTLTITTTPNSTFAAAVSLSVTGLPAGVTAGFAPASISTPGSGSSTLTLTAASSAAGGAYALTLKAVGGGITQTKAETLNIPGFALAATTAPASLTSGAHTTTTFTTHASGGFSSTLALSVSGLPTGVTSSFSPASIAAPGSGSTILTLTRGSTAKAGTSKLTVAATGSSLTQTAAITLTLK